MGISTRRIIATIYGTVAIGSMLTGCRNDTVPAAQTRDVTVTTVPLLVKESRAEFPFLDAAMSKGGVLDGKEVYAFSPSTITAFEGDTIRLHFINPEDDVHSFVLPGFAVSLPGNSRTDTTYIARDAGIFTFVCAIPSHLPMMSGQLVILRRR